MINETTISIPYPIKIGIFSINTTKRITLRFDNYSLFLFRENQNIVTREDFATWQKEHSEFDLFLFGAYYAAESFAIQNRKKFKVDVRKFAVGLAGLGKDQLSQLMDVWKRSQEYGSATMPGKKKRAAKR